MYVYACTYKHPDGTLSYYVGKHERPYEKSKWYLGSGKFCQNFKKKYGKEYTKNNVVKKILIHSLPDSKTLCKWEKIFIMSYRQIYGSLCRNFTDGGDGGCGPHKEEAKKKISKANKKMWECDKHRTKMSEINKKMWECDKFRAEMKEITDSPEYRAKISDAIRGEKNPKYNVNSVVLILDRILAGEGVRIPRTSFNRARRNPEHKKHAEYMELFNRYKVEVE